ncbi:MAG: butyrate kinase [Synergistaceae bacterium]|jgi:butyrate kinase|nr:butyrate kinase [Synergistaceae bacterium]
MKILAICPAFESTKVALYENYDLLWIETQEYGASELAQFPNLVSQEDFRLAKLRELLDSKVERLGDIRAFAATCGALHPVEGGTYIINVNMLQDLSSCKYGVIPANLGAPLAMRLATAAGSRYAYVMDPPVVDEMSETARLTGMPNVSRWSVFHALNHRAVAFREAANLRKNIADCNFVVCHLDDATSVAAHAGGKIIDVNDVDNASGCMSLRQSGDIPPVALINLCFLGKYSQEELIDKVQQHGGLSAHLGTSDFEDILRIVNTGDRKTTLIYNAYLFQIAKQIGACAAALGGNVDAVILTGRLAQYEDLSVKLSNSVSWIAPVVAYPGEDETLALVEGTIRVIKGEEAPKTYA